LINISINKKLDFETYNNFKDFSISGIDFGAIIKKDHPLINPDNFRDYIDLYYKNNIDILEKNCNELNILINEKQKAFFVAIKEIFGLDDGKKIQGYISIFNCNPRFVDSNKFQVFYKKEINDKIEVVFHEILHFIFFDYCSKNLPQETNHLNKNSGKLWELSEIINVIILNLPKFRGLIGKEEKLFYPKLKEKLLDIQNVWSKHYDMRQFILESLIILE
jgi:hypothetical protein